MSQPTLRRCSRCREHKPLTLFRKRIKDKYGVYYDSWCNPCTAEDAGRRNREKTKKIAAIKLERGCADCGYNAHPAALEFDHRPGVVKLFIIAAGCSSRGMPAILAEIEKCDVVCANCHAVRTWRRQTGAAS